jgi:hypothetical protein
MKPTASVFAPKRKTAIVRQLSDELLVYDVKTNKAHCLNKTAAKVWQLCDGKMTVAEISKKIAKGTTPSRNEDLVWLAIERLSNAGLLEQSKTTISTSRRAALRKLATATAIALPVIVSILVPTPAEAASCATVGQSCATIPCCTGGVPLICAPITKICV